VPSSRLLAAHRTLRDWMWRCADLRDRIAAKFNILCMSAASASL
jgi:hypothetical protein